MEHQVAVHAVSDLITCYLKAIAPFVAVCPSRWHVTAKPALLHLIFGLTIASLAQYPLA